MRTALRLALLAGLAGFALGLASTAGKTEGEPRMRITVHREGDKVWLEGVTGWFVGAKESSVQAAEEAVTQALGEDVTYDYLLGVSALAFRMQVSKGGLCPSSPRAFCGYECVDGGARAMPRKVTIFSVQPDDTARVKEARAAVVRSLEAGIPVQYGSEEDGVIVGYQKGGEEWLCLHPYREGGTKTFVETSRPWGIVVFGERKEQMPSRRALAVAALRQAVAIAHAEEGGEEKGYYVGFRAWEDYIQTVQSLDAADDKTRADAMQGNAWIYECLAQYRDSGARYLREIAGEFSPAAAAHLQKAADLYDRMANHVLRDEQHCVVTVAPYAWFLKEGQTWTPEMRAEQVRRLQAAFPLERRAVHEMEEALAAMDVAA